MFGFFVLMLLAGGLASLLPRVLPSSWSEDWLGSRFLLGLLVLPGTLYVGNMVFGVPLHWLVWGLVGLAGLGWMRLGRRVALAGVSASYAVHPLLWLGALFPLAVWWHDGVSYLSVFSDEYTNWLGWAQQMVVFDHSVRPEMTAVPPYLPGWTYLLALPGIARGVHDASNSAAAPLIFHIAFLGLLYDLLACHARRSLGWSLREASVVAWLFVLGFLLLETSWKLVPTDVMSERPQFYLMAGALLIAVGALQQSELRLRLSVVVGILLASAYLVKTAAIVFAPAVLGLSLVTAYRAYRDQDGDRVKRAIGVVVAQMLPFVFLYVSWRFIGSFSTCNANPSVSFIFQSFSGFMGRSF